MYFNPQIIAKILTKLISICRLASGIPFIALVQNCLTMTCGLHTVQTLKQCKNVKATITIYKNIYTITTHNNIKLVLNCAFSEHVFTICKQSCSTADREQQCKQRLSFGTCVALHTFLSTTRKFTTL